MYRVENFESWLRARPDDEEVGLARTTLACPVARWLLDTYGAPVSVNNITARVHGVNEVMDDKLCAFIERLDTLNDYCAPITKTMALSILKSVMKGDTHA